MLVDAEIFGLSPYGGLVRYWEHLLSGLGEHRIPVNLLKPRQVRAPLPNVPRAQFADTDRWVFHPTYLSCSPRAVNVRALTVHDTIYEDFETAARDLEPAGAALHLKRQRIAEADLIIVPSESTLKGLRRNYPSCRASVRLIPEGIDPHFVAPIGRRARAAARELRARADCTRPYLLHTGGREQYKNFILLLAAYLGTKLNEHFDLVAVGSQPAPLPAEAELLTRRPEGARVAFIGQVTTAVLAAFYRDAAALISPSLAEGFGLPPVEAAAGGTPVVHSAIPVFGETLGSGGFAFDPTDSSDCERAICAAVTSDVHRRRTLGIRLRRRFTWRETARKTIVAYRGALELS